MQHDRATIIVQTTAGKPTLTPLIENSTLNEKDKVEIQIKEFDRKVEVDMLVHDSGTASNDDVEYNDYCQHNA